MEQEAKKSPISFRKSAIRGAVLAVVIGVTVLLLFGLIAKAWLIGTLAAFCCMLGGFLCMFGWTYMKELEAYYKAHPPVQEEEDAPEEEAKQDE